MPIHKIHYGLQDDKEALREYPSPEHCLRQETYNQERKYCSDQKIFQ